MLLIRSTLIEIKAALLSRVGAECLSALPVWINNNVRLRRADKLMSRCGCRHKLVVRVWLYSKLSVLILPQILFICLQSVANIIWVVLFWWIPRDARRLCVVQWIGCVLAEPAAVSMLFMQSIIYTTTKDYNPYHWLPLFLVDYSTFRELLSLELHPFFNVQT
jgi:hypothetical protein